MTLFQVFEFAFACCSVASVALLIWDHAITFGAEVSRIWSRKFSGATVLYALLRYGTLLEKISILFLASWGLYILQDIDSTDINFSLLVDRCDIAVRFQIFPMILRSLAFGLFSSLRVYALQGNDWRLAAFIFLLCLPSVITPTYSYTHQWSTASAHDRSVSRFFAFMVVYLSNAFYAEVITNAYLVRIAGIAADIISESIVIIVTIRKTFRLRNNLSLAGPAERPGLGKLLFRDGTLYFFAILILSLADMLVLVFDHVVSSTLWAPQPVVGYDYWVVPYYTPVFRTIIICRFLLMLRAIYYDEGNEVKSQIGSLRFARSRVVGTLGTTVDPSLDDEDVDSQLRSYEDDEEIIYSKDPFATGLLLGADGSSKASSSGQNVEKTSEEIELSDYTHDRDSPLA
ncbi:hypothetical protein FPV67DRAFT_1754487 [Lyophyllum atratum]|nr:hypothetical protein FPV67DRAFT_1754487 [Lyophyllum atratum]